MQDNFEFDKIVLAIALGMFVFIFSDNFGNLFYRPITELATRGFEIEVSDSAAIATSSIRELPDVLDIAAIMAAANATNGVEIFKKCAVCHTADKNGVNKVGPNLWGIVNNITGHRSDFAYSTAMTQRHDQNIKWDYETLYRYLFAPKKMVPGTKMAFAGIKDDADRADLIAYIRTLADSPAPLPIASTSAVK